VNYSRPTVEEEPHEEESDGLEEMGYDMIDVYVA
jgi:hypothetical protein